MSLPPTPQQFLVFELFMEPCFHLEVFYIFRHNILTQNKKFLNLNLEGIVG